MIDEKVLNQDVESAESAEEISATPATDSVEEKSNTVFLKKQMKNHNLKLKSR